MSKKSNLLAYLADQKQEVEETGLPRMAA